MSNIPHAYFNYYRCCGRELLVVIGQTPNASRPCEYCGKTVWPYNVVKSFKIQNRNIIYEFEHCFQETFPHISRKNQSKNSWSTDEDSIT